MDKNIIENKWKNIKFTSIVSGGELSSTLFTQDNVKMGMVQSIPLLTDAAYAYAKGEASGLPLQVGSILTSMNHQAGLSMEEGKFYCSYCDKAYSIEEFGGQMGSVRFCRVCLGTNNGLSEAYAKTLEK